MLEHGSFPCRQPRDRVEVRLRPGVGSLPVHRTTRIAVQPRAVRAECDEVSQRHSRRLRCARHKWAGQTARTVVRPAGRAYTVASGRMPWITLTDISSPTGREGVHRLCPCHVSHSTPTAEVARGVARMAALYALPIGRATSALLRRWVGGAMPFRATPYPGPQDRSAPGTEKGAGVMLGALPGRSGANWRMGCWRLRRPRGLSPGSGWPR